MHSGPGSSVNRTVVGVRSRVIEREGEGAPAGNRRVVRLSGTGIAGHRVVVAVAIDPLDRGGVGYGAVERAEGARDHTDLRRGGCASPSPAGPVGILACRQR